MSEAAEYLKGAADTIVAVSSPLGSAPRGVIRLSGDRAVAIASRLLLRDGDPVPLDDLVWGARRANLLVDRGAAVPVDVWLMRGPRSYTGEDVLELHLPGGPALLDLTVARCREAGARPALPGEFTERAFLNGRLDLVQAEAVAAIIHAESEDERRAALGFLDGRAGREVDRIADDLKRLLAAIELGLDFSDQDIDIVVPDDLDRDLVAIVERISDELEERRSLPGRGGRGRLLLIGAVNAGKSSLFNALQSEQRAIVSDRPGTTRDYLEAELRIGKRCVTFIDCAGEGHDGVAEDRLADALREREAARADALVEVVDGRTIRRGFRPRPGALLVVATRADLVPPEDRGDLDCCWVAVPTGEGLDRLRRVLAERLELRGSGALVHLAARQGRLLERAAAAVARAREAAAGEAGLELVAADLHEALAALREITGADYSDQILSAIMRDFCIGK